MQSSKNIVEEKKTNPEAEKLKLKGNKAIQVNDYTGAITLYTKAIKICPQANYYSNRAFCKIKLDRMQEALEDCLIAIDLDKSFFRGYTRSAQCYLYFGRIPEALEVLRKGIAHVEDGEKLRKEMDSVNMLQMQVEKMKLEIEQSKFSEAVTRIELVQEKCNGDDSLMKKKIELLCLANETTKAKEYLVANEKRFRQMGEGEYDLQMCCVSRYSNDLDTAKALITKLLRMDPDNNHLKEHKKLIKKLESSKKEANGLFKEKKYEAAISKYEKIIVIDPTNSQFNGVILSNKATCQKLLGKKEEALNTIKEALKANPKFGKAFLKRADLEEELGDLDAAKQSIVKAKELDPKLDIDARLQRVTQKANRKEKVDYYKVLGVDKKATQKEIKKAYRKLAIKWHPDKHSQNPESKAKASKKFKEIVEANDILGNPEKRQRYDMGGFDLGGMGGMGGGRFHSFHMGGGGGFPSDLFSMFSGGGGMGGSSFKMHFGGGGGSSRGSRGTRRRTYGGGMNDFSSFFNH
jgi:DnaJ family protein C protein 7